MFSQEELDRLRQMREDCQPEKIAEKMEKLGGRTDNIEGLMNAMKGPIEFQMRVMAVFPSMLDVVQAAADLRADAARVPIEIDDEDQLQLMAKLWQSLDELFEEEEIEDEEDGA